MSVEARTSVPEVTSVPEELGEAPAPPVPEQPRARSAARWVAVACGTFITLHFTLTIRALDGFQLNNDLGIQYYLARATSRGAIPLIDFEHGWNTLSWYYSALLYKLTGGNASAWVFLWGRGGFIMAGIAMLVIAWRRRLPAAWMAGLTGAWIVLTHVAHNKYAIPTIWAAVLLPSGRVRLGWQRALRVVIAALVFWAHVELAILLAVGTAMYDLFGAREGSLPRRVVTAACAPLGVALGFASQVAVYAALGLAPGEFVKQAIAAWTVTEFGPLFDYPLGAPETVMMMLLPASLLVPFVPLVWRRLSDPTRLLALCHLALSLIAIRRPGPGHVGAAGTLFAIMAVLAVYDLTLAKEDLAASMRRLRTDNARAALAALGGACWFAVGVLVGFRFASMLAIVAITLVALSSVVASRLKWDLTAASVGGIAAAGLLSLAGVAGEVRLQVGNDDAELETTLIAEAIRDDLDDCLDGGDRAWVVPSPLTLYDQLDIQNPTPIYAFWYNLEGQADRLVELIRDGEIPVIIQTVDWPESMAPVVPEIEASYESCGEIPVEGTPRLIRLWRFDGA